MQAYPLAETARRARDLTEADRRALAEDLRAGLAVSLPLSTREKGTTSRLVDISTQREHDRALKWT